MGGGMQGVATMGTSYPSGRISDTAAHIAAASGSDRRRPQGDAAGKAKPVEEEARCGEGDRQPEED
jgi:hypothetical protein